MTLQMVILVGYGTGRWLSAESEPLRGDFIRSGGITSLSEDLRRAFGIGFVNESNHWVGPVNRVQGP
jgi:hypothetical protein